MKHGIMHRTFTSERTQGNKSGISMKTRSKRFMTFLIVNIFITVMLSLTGCSNKDYTKHDADVLLRKAHIKAEFLSEEVYGNDTVYRYEEQKTHIPFEVIEEHYRNGIDGASWDASRLFTNYPYVMSQYYIDRELMKRGAVELEYWDETSVLVQYKVAYRSDTILELEKDMDEFESLCKQIHRKNKKCQLKYSFRTSCTSGEDSVEFEATDKEYDRENILKEYKKDVFARYDEQYMSFLTEPEKQDILNHYEGRVYVDGKGSGVISLRGNTWLYPGAFVELMREYGYEVEETDSVIYVTDSNGITRIHPKVRISYIEIEQEYGLKLSQPRW